MNECHAPHFAHPISGPARQLSEVWLRKVSLGFSFHVHSDQPTCARKQPRQPPSRLAGPGYITSITWDLTKLRGM